jgi:hypothetical protein
VNIRNHYEPLGVRLPPDESKQLDEFAFKMNMNRSEVIRVALHRLLTGLPVLSVSDLMAARPPRTYTRRRK